MFLCGPGIKAWQKQIAGTPNGVLKGVGFVEGASPLDLLAIITTADARPNCAFFFSFSFSFSFFFSAFHSPCALVTGDSMFESGKLVEMLDEYHGVELGYAAAKAIFPVR